MTVALRPARPADVPGIDALVEPLAREQILLGKDLVAYYESVQEFVVATDDASGDVVGCGALHVMWSDLAEVRTLAVRADQRGTGLGHRILAELLDRAREMGLSRVFCLTFETAFFGRHGFVEMAGEGVDPATYMELLRSHDPGVAEFLDLARVKPNTLGNTRMILELDPAPGP